MIQRAEVTFSATGERFTPSSVPAPFSKAHDPGVPGKVGRYRGVAVPYGSADFEVPEEVTDKIAYVHRQAFPFLHAMRAAGAEHFSLRITYSCDAQCALGFSKEELKMILDLDCDFALDCMTAEEVESCAAPNRGPAASLDNSNALGGMPSVS